MYVLKDKIKIRITNIFLKSFKYIFSVHGIQLPSEYSN